MIATMGFAAGLAAGCAIAMNVSAHVEPGVDFRAFRTYEWAPADALPTGDPRLDKNPYFNDIVQGAVERQFSSRGLGLSAGGASDLLVHVHASVTDRLNPDLLDEQRGYGQGSATSGVTYEAGTIVVDVVHAPSGRLIWRGWAQTNLTQLLSNRDRMGETIDEAVLRMFTHWPAL
jgi:hypothetical protein